MSSHEFCLAKFFASPRYAARADLHPTDYELAVNYFLEEFAGDVAFVRGSEPARHPDAGITLYVTVREQRRACEGA